MPTLMKNSTEMSNTTQGTEEWELVENTPGASSATRGSAITQETVAGDDDSANSSLGDWGNEKGPDWLMGNTAAMGGGIREGF
mmetsp:Transcript_26820/g.48700  ORF Transcript_26820/g.48700 Transcript_26820/m.48700 type:complete len:83 (+) Transcript_26820:31-279(+)